jgi:hypothetical protein
MKIVFRDDNWIVVYEVRYDKILDPKNPQNIWIKGCNNYAVITYRNETGTLRWWDRTDGIFAHSLGQEINKSLNNLDDIFTNYEDICRYFDNLPDLPSPILDNWDYLDYDLPDEYVTTLEDGSKYGRFRTPVYESMLEDWVK